MPTHHRNAVFLSNCNYTGSYC